MRVHVHKSGIMQDMQKHISQGYIWHFSGEVTPVRAVAFAQKMEKFYAVDTAHTTRWRYKKAGRANARLFLYPTRDQKRLQFRVLLTNGEHPARSEERLHLVTDKRKRLLFDEKFEAVLLPSAGSIPRWTWRLTQSAYSEISDAIVSAVRKTENDQPIQAVIRDLLGMPGFRGIRGQMRELIRLIHADWKRIRKDSRCPYIGTKPKGFVQFFKIRKLPLDYVVDRMARGLKPIPSEIVHDAEPGEINSMSDRFVSPLWPDGEIPLTGVRGLFFSSKDLFLLSEFKRKLAVSKKRTHGDDDILSILLHIGLDSDQDFRDYKQQALARGEIDIG